MSQLRLSKEERADFPLKMIWLCHEVDRCNDLQDLQMMQCCVISSLLVGDVKSVFTPLQRTSRCASSRTLGRGRAPSPRPTSIGRWPLCSAHHRTATLTSQSQSESRCSSAGHPTARSASLWTSSTCLLTQVRRNQPVSNSVGDLWSSRASHQFSKSIPYRWVQAEWEEKAHWGHVPEPEAGPRAV